MTSTTRKQKQELLAELRATPAYKLNSFEWTAYVLRKVESDDWNFWDADGGEVDPAGFCPVEVFHKETSQFYYHNHESIWELAQAIDKALADTNEVLPEGILTHEEALPPGDEDILDLYIYHQTCMRLALYEVHALCGLLGRVKDVITQVYHRPEPKEWTSHRNYRWVRRMCPKRIDPNADFDDDDIPF